jgi:hypothetical protein
LVIDDVLSACIEFNSDCYNKITLVDIGRELGRKFNLEQMADNSPLGLCLADSLISNDGE